LPRLLGLFAVQAGVEPLRCSRRWFVFEALLIFLDCLHHTKQSRGGERLRLPRSPMRHKITDDGNRVHLQRLLLGRFKDEVAGAVFELDRRR
jgi:hypothetical protein